MIKKKEQDLGFAGSNIVAKKPLLNTIFPLQEYK